MIWLTEELYFPDPLQTEPHGIVAAGGDLKPERLLMAYHNGIFPWYDDDQPILWWSPDPRMVLFPKDLYISKSMRKLISKNVFKVTFNQSFRSVIQGCAAAKRIGQRGTWITDEMIEAYIELHELGHAMSVEVWQDSSLVGGLYGVDLGTVFCGESMFSNVSNASKVGFISLVEKLIHDDYKLIDCQIYTEHLASLGACEIPREVFLSYLPMKTSL